MRRRLRWSGWILGLALVASGCLPGYTVTEGGEPVDVTGRLDGELRDDGSPSGEPCVWLVGPSGERTHLFLLDEEMVEWEPLRLLDAAGSILARVGDTVTVTGPKGGVGFTPCDPSAVPFVVDAISGPGGTRSFGTTDPTLEP